MKLLITEQIKEADAYTIENEPIASIDLMERAASVCADWILEKYQKIEGSFVIFAGPGNNGGDGLAIARILCMKGCKVQVHILKFTTKFSEDFSVNLKRLEKQGKATIRYLQEDNQFPEISTSDVIIDSIFGSGLSRPLEKLPANMADKINKTGVHVISVDIPSGLFAEEAVSDPDRIIVRATHTLTFQFPKLSFFFLENEQFTGSWHMLPIGLHEAFIGAIDTSYFYTLQDDVAGLLKHRSKFSHKGTFGKGLLIAGSYGMMGAAVLSARAAIRSGIGLVTAHVPHFGYKIMQSAVPEALISIDESDITFTEYPDLSGFSAVAAGPALGKRVNSQKALKKLLENIKVPLVLDADALNIIGENKDWLELLPANTILTPHPKEFERITRPVTDSYERLNLQIEFSRRYNVIVVLKGAYTCISEPYGYCHFNSTGNPGMATGGTGDVLTGIILSLLAQQYKPLDAALCAVFVHGLAGDIVREVQGEEALIASDIIENLGMAFSKLKLRIENFKR